ncbi:capsular biosynthesis protein [Aliivibrio salmonicida]|uniref:capsular biosynthesis protein n=1 Tax=Aliivibrio salmonicida TaxID=40269 RepID=UPI003D12A4DE
MKINTGLYLQFYAVLTLIFCGLTQYFTGISSVLWLPFLLAFSMVGLLLLQVRYSPLDLDHKEMITLVLFLGFFGLAIVSTFLQNGVTTTIIGLKNELALSLILFCLLLRFCRESQIYRVTKALYWIFYAQFPVILFQVLVVVPKRVTAFGEFEKWDSVVGTFGGDPMGGGNTAAMGLFCLLIMLLKLSEYKHGLTTLKSTILHIGAAFILCILGEVKFVILLSPILLAYVWLTPSYIKGMKSYDLKIILAIVGGMLLLMSIAIMLLSLSYSSAFGGAADPTKGPLDIFIGSLEYIFDPNFIMPSGRLGRMTTIFFWLEHNDLYGIPSVLFGYGLNTTNAGSAMSPGFLNNVFNVILGTTSLSVLLWELGIIGTVFFISLTLYILRICKPKPLFNKEDITQEDMRLISYPPAFNAFAIGCLLSLPYSEILMLIPMLQFLFYLSLGSNLVIRKSLITAAANHD